MKTRGRWARWFFSVCAVVAIAYPAFADPPLRPSQATIQPRTIASEGKGAADDVESLLSKNQSADPQKVTDIARAHASGIGGGMDLESLAFLVLMEATKSAQEDLKAIMDQVKAVTKQRAVSGRDEKRKKELDAREKALRAQQELKTTVIARIDAAIAKRKPADAGAG